MNRGLLSLALLGSGLLTGSLQAADYQVDPVHTALIYRIKHLQSSYSYGRFNKVGGTFSYDATAPEKTAFNMSVETADIDSGNPQRDAHLKSPDFFNAKQFPTISFKSTAVKKVGDDKLEVTGALTVHGVTKPVTTTLTVVGTGKGMAGETRTGFEGTLEIKRSDFGMKGLAEAVGDDVRLIVSIEGLYK